MLLVGAVAILLGVGGGSLIAGSRLKASILERLEEEASDATAAPVTFDTDDERSAGGASDPMDMGAFVDSSASQPPAEDDTEDDGQELRQPAAGGRESIGQARGESIGGEPGRPAPAGGESTEPVPSTMYLDTASEVEVQGDSGTDGAQGIDPEASRAMAKIFSAMRPADAAAVLQGMENVEVQAILLSMGNRQAAQILGGFEAGRAAALAQLVLMTGTNGS